MRKVSYIFSLQRFKFTLGELIASESPVARTSSTLIWFASFNRSLAVSILDFVLHTLFNVDKVSRIYFHSFLFGDPLAKLLEMNFNNVHRWLYMSKS